MVNDVEGNKADSTSAVDLSRVPFDQMCHHLDLHRCQVSLGDAYEFACTCMKWHVWCRACVGYADRAQHPDAARACARHPHYGLLP